MPSIPFFDQKSGIEELGGGSPRIINAVVEVDSSGKVAAVRSRPGIGPCPIWIQGDSIGSPVIGIGTFEESVHPDLGDHVDLVLVGEDRRIWHVAIAGEESQLIASSTPDVSTKLVGSKRPVFAASKSHVVIAGGGTLQLWENAGLARRLSGSPPDATHACYLANRIVCNDTAAGMQERIWWSGAGETNHETWFALNYNEADARADKIRALLENTNELFAFGSETLQVASPDPVVGFAFGRAMNIGCSSPYSPVRSGDEFVWLNNYRRFVMSDGRSYQEIGNDIAYTMAGMVVDDGWGWRADLGKADLCGWVFPTSQRTFIWQRESGTWGEWRSRDANGQIVNFMATSLNHVTQTGNVCVGLDDGTLGELTFDAVTDNGRTFPVELVSGFINWDTEFAKRCISVRFTFKRGPNTTGTMARKVLISYRDDLGAFNSPAEFDLGAIGDYAATVEIRSAGRYRRRQWRLQFESDAALVFCGAEETFEKMDN